MHFLTFSRKKKYAYSQIIDPWARASNFSNLKGASRCTQPQTEVCLLSAIYLTLIWGMTTQVLTWTTIYGRISLELFGGLWGRKKQ